MYQILNKVYIGLRLEFIRAINSEIWKLTKNETRRRAMVEPHYEEQKVEAVKR